MTVKTTLSRRVLSVLLCLALLMTLIPASLLTALADGYMYTGDGTGIADRDTSTKYQLSLGDNASTEYAGRVWTDKSVYAGDATFALFGGGSATIKLNEHATGEDFLVAYSALGTSEAISGQAKSPVDVVLILDISGSMSNADSEMDNGRSRIANTVAAANDAIETLLAMNEYTRVSVVAFSNTAQVLLPLDRYSKTAVRGTEVDYLTLNTTRPGETTTLYVNAVASDREEINRSVRVTGGTNIQAGMYTGMNVLAQEKEITANINGSEIKRTPSVVLLSDGAPTYSSSSGAWWAPANNNNNGPGNTPYYGNGFKALLTGAYMKNAIDRNYKIAGTSYATNLYTIGMGVSELKNTAGWGFQTYYTGEQDLAYFTLNPGGHWNATNDMAKNIKGAWSTYTAHTPNNNRTFTVPTDDDETYTVSHPQSPLADIYTATDKDALKNLVKAYYDADNASAVTEVFEQIVSNIAISVPQVPTELKGDDPVNTGYITFIDPIGSYMEVKDVKAILYAGHTFTQKSVSTTGNVTSYAFAGEVDSAVYGRQDIDDILITVTEDVTGDQTMEIRIPASVMPIRVNSVELNEDGTVKTHTNNGAFPARVIYSVGMQSEVTRRDDSTGTAAYYVDTTKLSAAYLAAHSNTDGTVNFYSNTFTGEHEVNGSSAGDAIVYFEPAHNNAFYYVQEDMPLYADAQATQPATGSIRPESTYYYIDTYYHGTAVETTIVAIPGTRLPLADILVKDGKLYRAAGSPRQNHILLFEGTKVENATGTAEDFYAPMFEHAASGNPYDGQFVIHHGNNGLKTMTTGGHLEIRKTVETAAGLTAPDKAFAFTLDLNGAQAHTGTYEYVITDRDGNTVRTGTVSKDSPRLTLKDGQIATVYSLPPGTTYTVTEEAAAGFTTTYTGATGTIVAGETAVAAFTNAYAVTPVSFPTEGTLTGQKELAGRAWTDKDVFTFRITPYNNAPLPQGYDPAAGVTVRQPDVAGGNIATFDFGNIEFTAPGVYRYTLVEDEPDKENYLPGKTYSRALYRLVVTVEDTGEGTLRLVSYDIQKLYTDDATPLFTYDADNTIVLNPGQEAQDAIRFVNTYSAEDVVRVPVAMKDYTDNSGENPLVSGMFQFELQALGVVENGTLVAGSADRVPMPEGSENGIIRTTNEGQNITFPGVTFTQNVIPSGAQSVTFRYGMREVVPATAVNGMTYDTAVRTIDVVVSIDPESHVLNVAAIYPNGEHNITFRNTYTPRPVELDITGNKTLTGRDMKSGEVFEFVLNSQNAATALAVREGIVVVPDSIATVTGGKDGAAAAFAFENIRFKKAGTYTFAVTETAGNAPAVVYDDHTVTVTVEVTDSDKDGKLEIASATYSDGTAATFTNAYTSTFTGTPVSLRGVKALTGKTLLEGEFFFQVEEHYNGTKIGEGLVSHTADTTPDANGVYAGAITLLEERTYTAAGTYTYYFTEQIPDNKVGGTTYNDSVYRYTVVVEDVDYVGKLTVTSTKLEKADGAAWVTADAVVFTNSYTPAPTTATLPLINKIVAGERGAALAADEFQFRLQVVSATPADGIQLPAKTVVGNAANGNVLFDAITFTAAGTYAVSISEIIPADADQVPGVTYSTQTITAVYTVTDDRNGTLTAVLSQLTGGDAIVNHYKAEPAEVTLQVKKEFTGRENDAWLATDAFEFEIVVLDPATAQAIQDGKIAFPMEDSQGRAVKKIIDSTTPNKTISGKIRINSPGTYSFIVREVTGNIPGVHYDAQPREITIVATDDSAYAQIRAAVQVNGVDTQDPVLIFRNVYDASSTELSGHDHLTVNKIFTGREDDAWLDTDAFTFTLEAADIATQQAVTNGDVDMPAQRMLTVSNANKAHPHFGNIVFHKQGTYRFKITEVNNAIPGVTYDADADRIVVVSVTDNAAGGLVATLTNESEALTFTNSYTAKEVTLSGKENLSVTKSLIGRNWFTDDVFAFTLAPLDEATREAVEGTGEVTLSADTRVEIRATSAEATAWFGDILFKKAGTYTFVIKEVAGAAENMAYDPHHYVVSVEVRDNGLGQLVTAVTSYGAPVFENTYAPDAVQVAIRGEKKLEGTRPLAAGDFAFTLRAVTENAPLPVATTVTNTAAGVVDFGAIAYSAAGTYVYEIREFRGYIPGVTYDTHTVTATVTVTYDAATGKLSAAVAYATADEPGTQTAFTFVNTYQAEASEPVSLTAHKKVTPSAGNAFTLKGGEFSFILEGTAGAPMPAATTVRNDAAGLVDFGSVRFTEAGTYAYTIREVQGTLGGFTYDSAVYTITVEVTESFADAKMKTAVTVTDVAGKAADAVFDNRYDPKATSAVIFGVKELISDHTQLAADAFSFTLQAVTPGAPLPAVTTVTNAATGVFQFDTIPYTQVGVYKYTVTEVAENKKGYTYDDTVYTVTVTVTDAGEGQLQAAVAGVGTAQAPTITFVNHYTVDPVDVVLGADGELTKELAGRELNGEEFLFALLDGNNDEIATAKNGADGTFSLRLTFQKAGTYTYTLVERDNALAGVTYDEAAYTVTVVIADKGGYLAAESVTYALAGKTVEDVVFRNSYDATDVEVVLSAEKELIGRQLAKGEFQFALADEDGKEIGLATNGADGTVTFDKIVYAAAGTYRYTITEKDTDVNGVTYDDSVYAVEVVIVDKGGYLAADSITYTLEGKAVEKATFHNTYDAVDAHITFGATKDILGRDLVDGEFVFVLTDEDGNVIATATNTSDGKIVFDQITFSQAGVYTYTVYEEVGDAEHVTYDKTQFVIRVEVTDVGGQLVAGTPVIMKSGTADEVAEIRFENIYTVPEPDPDPEPEPEPEPEDPPAPPAPPAPPVPDSPQTGEHSRLGLWFALLLVGGGALALTVRGKKKAHSEENG